MRKCLTPPFKGSGDSGNSVLAAAANESLTRSAAFGVIPLKHELVTIEFILSEDFAIYNHFLFILCSILCSPNSMTIYHNNSQIQLVSYKRSF